MFSRVAAFATVIAAVSTVRAAITPLTPDGSVVFKTGETCRIVWSPDSSNKWTTMNIELMSGDNFDMVHIDTVGTVDGTKETSYEFKCPEVQPNSAIYFYQFSSPTEPENLTWTTRFAIGGADGSTTPPANATQPDGAKIPWGIGSLADPSTAKPAPSYIAGAAASGSGSAAAPSATASDSASASATGSASPSATASGSASGSASASAPSGMTTKAAGSATKVAVAASGSAAPSGSAGADSTSGALGAHAVSLSAVVFGALVGAIGFAL